MYLPAQFAPPSPAAVHDLIEAHAFGMLIAAGPDGETEASHLPFLLDRGKGPHGTLLCHVARANPIWQDLDGKPVLAVFSGPHGYISPLWYKTTPAVPTWNYMVAHARGQARLIQDGAALAGLVDRLSRIYEGAGGWRMADQPERFLEGLLRGIVGIEIPIDKLEGKFKLNQHRPNDLPSTVLALEASGSADNLALAKAMQAFARRKAEG